MRLSGCVGARIEDVDLVIWDNRSLLHCVVSDATGERLLHKVTVGGESPA
jgi:alpha-ketoglutarate-dependent taurine dioxygenase